jgi:hypothetical protein
VIGKPELLKKSCFKKWKEERIFRKKFLRSTMNYQFIKDMSLDKLMKRRIYILELERRVSIKNKSDLKKAMESNRVKNPEN